MSEHPITLITGATSGIGLALARDYAQRGHRLVLVGRRPLAELPYAVFSAESYCQADLNDEASPQKIAQFLEAQGINQLDLLIHNAGIGYAGPFYEQDEASIDAVLDLNLLAPIALTHALLPWLKQAQGKLVFISSMVASLPLPNYAVYIASKAALDGFARSLRVELAADKVAVQVIRPGATRTALHAKVGLSRDQWQGFPDSAHVAAEIIRLINGPRRDAAVGLVNQLGYWAGLYAGGVLEKIIR